MASSFRELLLLLLLLLLPCTLFPGVVRASLDPIEIKGSKFFFKSNGTQFQVRGVWYQSSDYPGQPFLDDTAGCQRDIPYFQKLGVNVVSSIVFQALADHSGCMQAFDDAGIYVLVHLNPVHQLDSNNITGPQWTPNMFQHYGGLIDAFQNYTNLLGFYVQGDAAAFDPSSSGVNGTGTGTGNGVTAAFVRAVVRDLKAYMRSQNYRNFYIGYSSEQLPLDQIQAVSDYFACGDPSERIDFLGLDYFGWCGQYGMSASGYSQLVTDFANFPVPVFFSEYGCKEGSSFDEVQAIYGPNMSDVFSGGIVYEWLEESNSFGLASTALSTVATLTNFDAFSTQLASAPAAPTLNSDDYHPTTASSSLSCPTTDSVWVAATVLPPTPYNDVCQCMWKSLSCQLKSNPSVQELENILDVACGGPGRPDCGGILTNGTTGVYGAFSFCDNPRRTSWAMDMYYKSRGSHPEDCDFQGLGTLHQPQNHGPDVPAEECNEILSQAGTAGTNTLTFRPSFTRFIEQATLNTAAATETTISVSMPPGTGPTQTASSTPIPSGSTSNQMSQSTIGIAVGVSVGVTALAALIFAILFFRRRQSQQARDQPGFVGKPRPPLLPFKSSSSSFFGRRRAAELDDSSVSRSRSRSGADTVAEPAAPPLPHPPHPPLPPPAAAGEVAVSAGAVPPPVEAASTVISSSRSGSRGDASRNSGVAGVEAGPGSIPSSPPPRYPSTVAEMQSPYNTSFPPLALGTGFAGRGGSLSEKHQQQQQQTIGPGPADFEMEDGEEMLMGDELVGQNGRRPDWVISDDAVELPAGDNSSIRGSGGGGDGGGGGGGGTAAESSSSKRNSMWKPRPLSLRR